MQVARRFLISLLCLIPGTGNSVIRDPECEATYFVEAPLTQEDRTAFGAEATKQSFFYHKLYQEARNYLNIHAQSTNSEFIDDFAWFFTQSRHFRANFKPFFKNFIDFYTRLTNDYGNVIGSEEQKQRILESITVYSLSEDLEGFAKDLDTLDTRDHAAFARFYDKWTSLVSRWTGLFNILSEADDILVLKYFGLTVNQLREFFNESCIDYLLFEATTTEVEKESSGVRGLWNRAKQYFSRNKARF